MTYRRASRLRRVDRGLWAELDGPQPELPLNHIDRGKVNNPGTLPGLFALGESLTCPDCDSEVEIFTSARGIEVCLYHSPTCPTWKQTKETA